MKQRKWFWSNKFLLLGSAILSGSAQPHLVYSQGVGTSGAQILKSPIGSRAIGMGGAFSAVSDDASAIHWNPAGLALLKRQQITTMYLHGLADTKMEFLGYSLPLPFSFLERNYSLGVSALFSQLGKIDLLQTNPDGSIAESKTISAGSDMVLSLSCASLLSETSLTLPYESEDHYLGVSARFLMSTLAEQYTAKAASVDIGYLSQWRYTGLRWALVAQNLGSKMKFKQVQDPLPTTFRAGLAWQKSIPFLSAYPLTLAVEGSRDREKKMMGQAGIEYWFAKKMALRMGYRQRFPKNGDQASWTTGFGLNIPGLSEGTNLILDYSFVPVGALGFTHHASLSFAFGKPREIRPPPRFGTRF